ncbi:MAG TPA: bifunctional glutamate N-acetyltransferase/amino-acid acetyltransferase ArgJ [Desulfobacteraceae bacterium]|nr:bifunctional glutamate N-acetyltransferase/amino-acid acetyltransferase ArgJ [Desulfobacteraceae bacterium]
MKGFWFKGVASGIKKDGKKDIGLICSEEAASAAALFTTNKVVAAPVVLGRERIRSGRCQAVVVNSGNANCFTGEGGMADALETARLAGQHLHIPEALVMVSSTGVIGAPLPMDAVKQGVCDLADAARQGNIPGEGLEAFARAILTTDTFTKVVTDTGTVQGKPFTITGIAKGSGMIKPDMATMLAFVCTDLDIPTALLNTCLKKACDQSFNRISVDGDTSTNDTVLALANGMSGASLAEGDDIEPFQRMLDRLLFDLAKMVVKDGEGATKVVKITVRGAKSPSDALKVAHAISHSNLVKTAIYGEDPNWGRITAAAGRSGAEVDPDLIDLFFEEVPLVEKGQWQGKEAEKEAARIMKNDEMEIVIDLNLGAFTDFYLFCDFSEDYVRINADYRS